MSKDKATHMQHGFVLVSLAERGKLRDSSRTGPHLHKRLVKKAPQSSQVTSYAPVPEQENIVLHVHPTWRGPSKPPFSKKAISLL